MLPLRELGRSGIKLPPVMLGGNVFGWTADVATSLRVLDEAVAQGLNAIDTADAYSRWVPGHGGGESEAIIGVWLKERKNRDKLIIATKLGMDLGRGRTGLSARRVREAVEASLTRLQTDYIDLYQAHCDDASVKLEETLGAFAELIREGKVRAIGASNYTAPRFEEALAVSERLGLPRYESLQPLYNLVERPAFEAELRDVCVRHNVGVINYYALASGFLTGKYRSVADFAGHARGGGAKKYFNKQGQAVLAALDAQGTRLRASVPAVALAWCYAQPGITAPIASASRPEQLGALVEAARLSLDEEALAALNAASA